MKKLLFIPLYACLSGFAVGRCAKGTLWLSLSDWTPEGGFFLNGVATKFHGVSLHHDHGALGAEENYKAEYRRLKQMKDMGVNAIRTTHNPASEQTLKIAAELGLMVQEEAFDTWYGGKKQYDYGRFL